MQPSISQSISGVPDQTGLMPNNVKMSKMIESGWKTKEFYTTGTVKWDAGDSALQIEFCTI